VAILKKRFTLFGKSNSCFAGIFRVAATKNYKSTTNAVGTKHEVNDDIA